MTNTRAKIQLLRNQMANVDVARDAYAMALGVHAAS